MKLLVRAALGAPFSWAKLHGGIAYDWLGYWVDYGTFQLGFSEKRSTWIAGWLADLGKRGA
eukprot:1135297-Alexandrium_andersonii.AAC.1